MHLVIKNLSPEDFKKDDKGGITCVCKWAENYKKKKNGASFVFFGDSVDKLKDQVGFK